MNVSFSGLREGGGRKRPRFQRQERGTQHTHGINKQHTSTWYQINIRFNEIFTRECACSKLKASTILVFSSIYNQISTALAPDYEYVPGILLPTVESNE